LKELSYKAILVFFRGNGKIIKTVKGIFPVNNLVILVLLPNPKE